ncbi:MAG: hypothetical protein JW706_10835 [Opitutales bacterium]|nr:hypothetical protein [Opitutales bacterium]
MKSNKLVMMGVAILISATAVSQAATLGQRTVGAFGGFSKMEDVDGWAASAELNLPVAEQVDLRITFLNADMDGDDKDFELLDLEVGERILMADGIWYIGEDASGVRPFVGVVGGYSWIDLPMQDQDGFLYGGTAGVEIPFSDVLSFRLSGHIIKSESDHVDDLIYKGSAEANIWVSESVGIVASYTYSDQDGNKGHLYTGGLRLRF